MLVRHTACRLWSQLLCYYLGTLGRLPVYACILICETGTQAPVSVVELNGDISRMVTI